MRVVRRLWNVCLLALNLFQLRYALSDPNPPLRQNPCEIISRGCSSGVVVGLSKESVSE